MKITIKMIKIIRFIAKMMKSSKLITLDLTQVSIVKNQMWKLKKLKNYQTKIHSQLIKLNKNC